MRRGQGGRKRGRPPKNRVTWRGTKSSPTKKPNRAKPKNVRFRFPEQDVAENTSITNPVIDQSTAHLANDASSSSIKMEVAAAISNLPDQEIPHCDEPELCGVHEVKPLLNIKILPWSGFQRSSVQIN